MEPFLALAVSMLVFRGAGALGVRALASWREAARYALVCFFLFTASSHFTSLKYDLAAMIPDPFPQSLWLIYLTGVAEIAGAIGLVIPRTRKLAGICLAVMLVGLLPANVKLAINEIPFGGKPPALVDALWLRVPLQFVVIALIAWTSIRGERLFSRPRGAGAQETLAEAGPQERGPGTTARPGVNPSAARPSAAPDDAGHLHGRNRRALGGWARCQHAPQKR